VRLVRDALRAWERYVHRPTWQITDERQLVPAVLFGEHMAEGLEAAAADRRLYCVDRRDMELCAGLAWTVDGGGMSVITHLGLARDNDGRPFDASYTGAMLLLERLSDIGHAERRSTTVAVNELNGATHQDLRTLSFKHRGFHGEHVYERPDRAHPLRLLRIAYLRWTRPGG
jgi:hypothetical protein